ncbi:U-box domain-containing protein 62-like [Camellia sinensis]|nr:U-box domain-containing protein 62-like [Camellia sinensis]
MASEEIGLIPPPHRLHNGLTSQLAFHDQGLCYFQPQESARTRSAGDEQQDEYEDDQDDDDDSDNNKNHNSNNIAIHFGSNRGVLIKDCNVLHSGNDNSNARAILIDNHRQGRFNQYQNEVTIADPDRDLYHSHYLQGPEGLSNGQKGIVVGFSGRKEGSYSSESGESLWMVLSDPLTGELMDDAMILPCGHSFGSGGIQHIIRMKACYTCSQPVSEESVSPNLSLRSAVQAFLREEELQVCHSSKRRRERFEQDKGSYGDPMPMDHPRRRGVQFPFAVADRVIIMGNKRTPQHFVGREATVTTQCLNGWYVVKTLDNAESVKLQYRSLAKVPDNPSSKPATSKMTPNWL